MNEKRRPHYPLADIKTVFGDAAKLNRTFSSKLGADGVEMDDAAVVRTIQALQMSDFDKSMTSAADHRVWQDVYKPTVGKTKLYVKFTEDTQGNYLLISFKEV